MEKLTAAQQQQIKKMSNKL